jgi:hypothetical protein
MFSDVILDLSEVANGQTATLGWLLGGDVRVFFDQVRDEELCQCGYAELLSRHTRGQEFGASQTDGPQDFVTAKKVDHLSTVCVTRIASLQRGQERLAPPASFPLNVAKDRF